MKTIKKDFIPGEVVTVIGGTNFLEGKSGIVIKFLDPPHLEKPFFDRDGTLVNESGFIALSVVVDFPDVPIYLFNSHHDSSVPEAEKRWIYFHTSHLILGVKPLSEEKRFQKELAKINVIAYSRIEVPLDGTCCHEGCNNYGTGYAWVNCGGVGHRFFACRWHLEEFGGRWCDFFPFKLKEVIPQLFSYSQRESELTAGLFKEWKDSLYSYLGWIVKQTNEPLQITDTTVEAVSNSGWAMFKIAHRTTLAKTDGEITSILFKRDHKLKNQSGLSANVAWLSFPNDLHEQLPLLKNVTDYALPDEADELILLVGFLSKYKKDPTTDINSFLEKFKKLV